MRRGDSRVRNFWLPGRTAIRPRVMRSCRSCTTSSIVSPIDDFGDLDGRPFIVTEFVEGGTLRQRLDAGRLALHEAIQIGSQVAGALAAAHAGGIVHRDVKPDNVMIRPDGYVKVLDFGLAKLLTIDEPVAVGVGAHTTPGMVMGTPRYMSPEQARGAAADPRSDVWSFGVMLYEMIAGCPPFVGATPADLIGAILHTEPVPLELQAPRTPPALGRIVARSLRKKSARTVHLGE
jgi:serine/threonine protein kinase